MASYLPYNSALTQDDGVITVFTTGPSFFRQQSAAPALLSRPVIRPEPALRIVPETVSDDGVATGAPNPVHHPTNFATRRLLWQAWRAVLAIDLGSAAAHIATAELALAAAPAQSSRRYRQEIEILRAAFLAYSDESLASLGAMQAIHQDELNKGGANIAAIICRLGCWKLGDLARLHGFQSAGVTRKLTSRRALQAVFSLSIDAAAAFQRLRFPLARRLAVEAVAIADEASGPGTPSAALPAAIAAQILYEEGYLQAANAMIASRLGAIKAGGTIESAIRAYTVFARIAAHQNQVDLAFMVLRDAEILGEQREWPRLISASVSQRLEFCIRQSQISDAQDCLRRLQLLAAAHHQFSDSAARAQMRRAAELGRCKVLLATGQARPAIASLRQTHHEAACGQDLLARFHLELCLAQALDAAGETAEALGILWDAVKTGANIGLYQAFVDGGDRIAHLLAMLFEQPPGRGAELEIVIPFIKSLCDRRRNEPDAPFRNKTSRRTSSYLSERELGILHHISLGYSNKAIAQAKDVAPETVKSHVKHIFVKLGVGTRAQAVARGQALGLI